MARRPSQGNNDAVAVRCGINGSSIMESENFERSLRAFARRTPFQSFVVRFVDGNSLTIDHLEALVLRGGNAAYIRASGQPTFFDHRSVSQLTTGADAAAAS